MALLREMHPDWTVEQLKALAMNTATNDIRSGTPLTATIYGPGRVGAGRIELPNTADTNVVAYNADNPGLVSVSFGAPEVLVNLTAIKNVRVVNKGSGSASYTVSYVGVADVPGVAYSLPNGTAVIVPGNGVANIPVMLTADASQMQHTRDDTVSASGPRQWLSEEAGYLVLTPTGGGAVLRVPLYAAPRPASQMSALNLTAGIDVVAPLAGQMLNLTGVGVNTGSDYPTAEVSLVTALELQGQSVNDASSVGLNDNADLQYIGAMSDFAGQGSITNTEIFIGIATYGDWTTPSEVEFDIYFDVDQDSVEDYALFNWNTGSASGGNPTDVFVSYLVDLNTGDLFGEDYLNYWPSSYYDTVLFNTNVMVMGVYAADLGLTDADGAFDYYVVSFNREASGNVDVSALMTYDVTQPAVDTSGGQPGIPMVFDLPGSSIQVSYDTTSPVPPILLLHHHNTTGNRAEIAQNLQYNIYLPVIRR
jgi:hypothetical protein